ncbi:MULTISPECIES: hypothetical protein [unclassified Nocardiopsis]|uniref:hypothetical protein n=1 Tax=Nocardiopsis TaxID=2013 RepID=UPI00387B1842
MTGEDENARRAPEPGPAPTESDLVRAENRQRLQAEQPDRVRSAALAWRNGLAGVLVALAGFGLVQGREDITRLAVGPAIGVGVLMASALVVGLVSAGLLLYAAHGFPLLRSVDDLLDGEAEYRDAERSADALRRGVGFGGVCVLFLVASVALGWYGPEREDPLLRVAFPGETVCGRVEATTGGRALLRGSDGAATWVELAQAQELRPVRTCG